jgi:hypothetical protein
MELIDCPDGPTTKRAYIDSARVDDKNDLHE